MSSISNSTADLKYRSRKILDAAEHCPYCMYCGTAGHGNIVAAHSNQQRDGKGLGTKAHDFRVAFLCDRCHYLVDQSDVSYECKVEIWEGAHRNTIFYLFMSGVVK